MEQPLEIDVPVSRKGDVPLVLPEPAPLPTPKRREGPTRVDRGLALLREKHPASVKNPELMEAMGLPVKHSPYSYMQSAIRSGRAVYANRVWSLGANELSELEAEAAQPAAATGAEWVAQADPEGQVDFAPAAGAGVQLDAAAAWVAAAEDEPAAVEVPELAPAPAPVAGVPSIVGGLPMLTRPPFVPAEVEPGAAVLDFSRPGVYENGIFRRGPEKTVAPEVSESAPLSAAAPARDPAAERFLSGILSDGSLHLRIPGMKPFDLEPEHARALWEMMRLHGYAAWKTAA